MSRIAKLNDLPAAAGDYVLYWMQQSQRAACNDALEYAVTRANEAQQPLLICFGLTDDYPEANLRHYTFMLEGLRDVGEALEQRGIGFSLQHGDPAEVALKLGRHASLIVCDRGYLRPQKAWRARVAAEAHCAVVQVECDVVVPVNVASTKREFAARTLRPKLTHLWPEYLRAVTPVLLRNWSLDLVPRGLDWRKPDAIAARLKLDGSVSAVTEHFRGGTQEAEKVFTHFCDDLLRNYKETRNQPQTDNVSQMSKYLHFGQISPVWLALEVRKYTRAAAENVAGFIDELLVRRVNEMRFTGYMHNQMRMYWGKKILEWTRTPEEAHATALAINNKYFLDGRDANSFANIAWVFGQHDRPWFERPVFGKIRYMNAAGLERKCDVQAYMRKIDALITKTERV